MEAGSLFVLVLFLAGFVEWLVERIFGPIAQLKGWPMVLISAAAGVALCFGFRVDALSLVGFETSYPAWLGYIITGVIVGSGANTVHKFLKPSSSKSGP